MAHEQRQSTLIQVKSTPTDSNHIVKFVDVRNKSPDGLFEEEVMAELMERATKDEKPADDCVTASDSLATSKTTEENATATEQIDEQHGDTNTGNDGGFIKVHFTMADTANNAKDELKAENMNVDNNGGEIKEDIGRKKKKKKKKKKGKKKKNDSGSEGNENGGEFKLPIRLAPIKKSTGQVDTGKTELAPPEPAGCFGFVSTWLAKRKEKRREKKRKAIEARKGKSVGKLLEYQHKQARGGVAFIVEVDNRPMNKSVLPPISRRPGPIRMAIDQKMEKAENKRTEQINKKRDAARAHSRLVKKVNERRAERETRFKQSTLENMQAKQERVSSQLDFNKNQRAQSRCTSKMRSKLDVLTARWEAAVAAPIVYREISPPLPLDEDVSSIDYYTDNESDVSINSWDYWRQ